MTAIMIISVALMVGSYLVVCSRDRSVLNWLTPAIVTGLSAQMIFPYINNVVFGREGSLYAYVYCCSATVIQMLLAALIYSKIRVPGVGWTGTKPELKRLHWIVLFLSAALYAPVLIAFRNDILNPRAIYNETRAGFGITFFGSAVLLNLAFCLFLFRKNKGKLSSAAFVCFVSVLSVLHGSKGQLLTFFWVWILYKVYVEGKRFRFREALKVLGSLVALMLASFVFFGIASPETLLLKISSYTDYSRNAALVIDDANRPTYFGKLALENTFYSRLPRSLFPNKPTVFGTFHLTRRYFATSEWEGVGSPDFGIGIPYADFGPFAIFYIAAWSVFQCLGLMSVLVVLRSNPNPANFVMLCFFANVTYIPLGIGYLLPEHFLLSAFLWMLVRTPGAKRKPWVVQLNLLALNSAKRNQGYLPGPIGSGLEGSGA